MTRLFLEMSFLPCKGLRKLTLSRLKYCLGKKSRVVWINLKESILHTHLLEWKYDTGQLGHAIRHVSVWPWRICCLFSRYQGWVSQSPLIVSSTSPGWVDLCICRRKSTTFFKEGNRAFRTDNDTWRNILTTSPDQTFSCRIWPGICLFLSRNLDSLTTK